MSSSPFPTYVKGRTRAGEVWFVNVREVVATHATRRPGEVRIDTRIGISFRCAYAELLAAAQHVPTIPKESNS
jgi:hypothetical protein